MLFVLTITSCSSESSSTAHDMKRIHESKQYFDGKFRNQQPSTGFSFSKLFSFGKDYFNNKSDHSEPEFILPIHQLVETEYDLQDKDALRFSRLGHSTVLIQMNGKYFLTDPVFSERASPVQWAGPKRFHPVPIDIDSIDEIEAVLISHNHYDHLDAGSIQQLKDRVKHFIVPLGVAEKLIDWGVNAKQIIQLDWWENIFIDEVELVFTPAQHFSGRGFGDRNTSLWGSWVIRNQQHALFFSGDSGYFPGFKEIGERYGPFDYAFLECGAYNKLWRDIHMMPEDTIQAFIDVKGKVMVPIHNGTFDLSTHSWFDPMERISKLAKTNSIELLIPLFGQLIDSNTKVTTEAWWLSPPPTVTFVDPALQRE